MARTATRRTATGRTKSARATTATRIGTRLERCPHGLLKGTCAICLQMEETVDLTTGKLAPEERPGRLHDEDEDED
ncbi:MAG TPA: hypothetical protein VGK88_02345 [bacterium]|jgi:hypothetical protein